MRRRVTVLVLCVCVCVVCLSVCYHPSGDLVHFNVRSKVHVRGGLLSWNSICGFSTGRLALPGPLPDELSPRTVEPLNSGHIGMDYFVHYREVIVTSPTSLVFKRYCSKTTAVRDSAGYA